MGAISIPKTLEVVCGELSSWLATLPAWENAPWVSDSRGYRGPTLLGEADCRMHLVRLLADEIPPDWLHQEVPTSAYLFPTAPVPRQSRIDIGIVDPARLHAQLTAQEMRSVRWNALIEVKFRGNSPGWEFAAAPVDQIAKDLEKLDRLSPVTDHAEVVVIEELPPLDSRQVEALRVRAPEVTLRFVGPAQTP